MDDLLDIEVQEVVLVHLYQYNRMRRKAGGSEYVAIPTLVQELQFGHSQTYEVICQLDSKGLVKHLPENPRGGFARISEHGIERVETGGRASRAISLHSAVMDELGRVHLKLEAMHSDMHSVLYGAVVNTEAEPLLKDLLDEVSHLRSSHDAGLQDMSQLREAVDLVLCRMENEDYKPLVQLLSKKGLLEGLVTNALSAMIVGAVKGLVGN